MGMGSRCFVFGPESHLVVLEKSLSFVKGRIGDIWKCFTEHSSRQTAGLGVGQPELEFQPC